MMRYWISLMMGNDSTVSLSPVDLSAAFVGLVEAIIAFSNSAFTVTLELEKSVLGDGEKSFERSGSWRLCGVALPFCMARHRQPKRGPGPPAKDKEAKSCFMARMGVQAPRS